VLKVLLWLNNKIPVWLVHMKELSWLVWWMTLFVIICYFGLLKA